MACSRSADPFQILPDSFRRLRPDAVHHFQSTAIDELSQVLERSDLVLLMKRGCGLWADARQLQKIEHGFRRLCRQSVPRVERTLLQQLDSFPGNRFADTWDF